MKNLIKTVAVMLILTSGLVACENEEIKPDHKPNNDHGPNIEFNKAQADGTGDGEDEGDPIIQETP